ncbi:SulP family inorganic anion transporter [Dongshaea marina]|uniref:SulP family inorganic anion transporter n=1 Tax=Dongshaea marina TaxID=2047966 RepID=UPI000D3EC318|nr:SulP family inorganic anion transporter [Dongshaea marina]
MLTNFKKNWLSNIRGDTLSGIVVALALIPEAIAFSIIAGVDPKVGLYASFCIAVVTALAGGRAGMISGATGAMALLMVTLVKEHGLQYLLCATLLTGVLQIIFGYLNLGNLIRFVSSSVVTGFVNSLAILIFMAQLPEITHAPMTVYALVGIGLLIIYLFPFIPLIGKLLPSPLICILILTLVSTYFELNVHTVGDMGQLPSTLPIFLWPQVPLTLHTLYIILPYSVALALVGLLESMMTVTIIDELTNTTSHRNRECKGQGLANIVSGMMGGMAGCAMIGQSMINIKSGGRSRLSTLFAGIFLLFMVLCLDNWIRQIPMAALVAIMIMVSIGTFSWDSILHLKRHPLTNNIIMLVTVVAVVATENLAIGVLIGVFLSALFFAQKIAHRMEVERVGEENSKVQTYRVRGHVFFASTERFISSFDSKEALDHVVIDLAGAHFWDICAMTALDKVVLKLQNQGAQIDLLHFDRAKADYFRHL